MGPVTSKPRAQTVLGITVDNATKSLYQSQLIALLLPDITRRLASELDGVIAHVDKVKVEVGSFFYLKTKEEYALAFEEVEKGIDALGETADSIQGDMKKAAADFVRMIADET